MGCLLVGMLAAGGWAGLGWGESPGGPDPCPPSPWLCLTQPCDPGMQLLIAGWGLDNTMLGLLAELDHGK